MATAIAAAIAAAAIAPVKADIGFLWRAGLTLLAGGNPYHAAEALLYPLPAVLVALPLTALPEPVATRVFVGVSAGLLAFALWPHRLPALLSVPMWLSVRVAQWPPLLMAGALLAGLRWLWVVKPNLGVVTLAHRTTRWGVVVGGALVVASLLVLPTWPLDWLRALQRQPTPHLPMLFWPLGIGGLVGLWRWRTPEGRSLAALTVVPVSAMAYDLLLLHLCARTAKESWALTIAGWVAFILLLATGPHDLVRRWTSGHLILSLCLILPAALIVLRQRSPRVTGP